MSKSASNQLNDGTILQFVTMRQYMRGRSAAEKSFDGLLEALKSKGFWLSNVLREYTVYDTNLGLDAGWIDNGKLGYCYTGCKELDAGECPFMDERALNLETSKHERGG